MHMMILAGTDAWCKWIEHGNLKSTLASPQLLDFSISETIGNFSVVAKSAV
jgi:hypothetical protein